MIIVGYFSSLLMGLSLGLIGGGGSILTVPILVYLFSVNPIEATSQSLFIVGTTALFGAVLALRRGDVDLKMAIQFAVPSFVGVSFSKLIIVPRIPDLIFQIYNIHFTKQLFLMCVFAILMLMASLAMIRKNKNSNDLVLQGTNNSWRLILLQGFLVGVVTGMVGAGGGFLIVPALVTIIGLKMRSAIGTSLMIIAANSLFGFALAFSRGLSLSWSLLINILMIALIGLAFGSYYSHKIPEKKLKIGFGYFVLIMGAFILFDQISKL